MTTRNLRLVPDPPSRNPKLKGTPSGLLEVMDAFHAETTQIVTDTLARLNANAEEEESREDEDPVADTPSPTCRQ